MNNIPKFMTFYGLLTGISLQIVYSFYKEIQNFKKQLKILKNKYSPSQLLEKLIKKDDKIYNLFQIKQNQASSNQLMIIGTLQSQNPIITKNNDKLILQLNLIQEKYANSDFIPDQNISYKSEFRQYIPFLKYIKTTNFQIADIEKESVKFTVDKSRNQFDFIDQLDLFDQKYQELNFNVILQFFVALSKLLYGFCAILGFKDYLGFTIGFEEKQLGLKVGTVVNVIGKVVYNFEDQSFKLVNPSIIMKNPKIYKKFLKENIFQSKFFILIFGIASLFTFSQFYYYLTKYLTLKKKIHLQMQNSRNNIKKINNFFKNTEELKCMICLDKTRSLIYKPCLHFATCSACFDSITNFQCIVCRNNYQGIIDVLVQD